MRAQHTDDLFQQPTPAEIRRHIRNGRRIRALYLARSVRGLGRRIQAAGHAAAHGLAGLARQSHRPSATQR